MSVTVIPRVSEEAWLAERRTRITATDIARLANGGPAAQVAVKAEKLGAAGFRGNRYTEWGKYREPLILDHLGFLFDIAPNADLWVNGDRAATPDGIGETGGSVTRLAEAKTTTFDWWRGDEEATFEMLGSRAPQYLDQVYWAQAVCEVEETIFAWEPHHDFVPGEIRHLTIRRDEKRLAYLFEVEQRFLDYWHSDDVPSVWAAWHARYAEAEQDLKRAEAWLESLKTELREHAGDDELVETTPFGSISYKWPKPRKSFDQAGFQAAHPELARKFSKTVPPKHPTLRITTT